MPTIPRCLMHNYEFDTAACKQCCMLLRNNVVCRWLDGTDKTDLIVHTLHKLITKREGKMFFTKDRKGKYELHPGIINMLRPEEALKDIKLEDIEEIYEIFRVTKPELRPRLVTVEGLPVSPKPQAVRKKKPKETPPEDTVTE